MPQDVREPEAPDVPRRLRRHPMQLMAATLLLAMIVWLPAQEADIAEHAAAAPVPAPEPSLEDLSSAFSAPAEETPPVTPAAAVPEEPEVLPPPPPEMRQAPPEEVLPPPTFAPPRDVEVPENPESERQPLSTREVTFPTRADISSDEPQVMIGRPVPRPTYGSEGNRQAARLRSFPPEQFTFDRASLRDVLRFLAEEAGIPYIGIPEHSPQAQRLVTLRMTASPFAALESVARQNDIQMSYEDGVWFMRLRDANLDRARATEDENELIAVVYQLKHDPVDRVSFRTESQGMLQQQDTRGGTAATPQLALQQPQRVFEVRAPRIVREIRTMLGMDPFEAPEPPPAAREVLGGGGGGLDAGVGGGAAGLDGGAAARVASAPQRSLLPSADGTIAEGTMDKILPVYVPPQETQVIYNSDTNILWVVATRRQHRWVADYLRRVDKPQDLIAIEVKFFETRKNPRTDFGINWANTFGTGLTVGGRASIGSADSIGSIDFVRSQQRGENRGDIVGTVDNRGFPDFSLAPTGSVDNNLTSSSVSGSVPYSAILSLDQFSFTIQAFMEDRDSSLVQYPRVLTINNREVAITSAENTPVNAGVQNVSSGNVGGQNVGTLEYIPVGTQINILPKAVGSNQIALTVAITISQIIDFVRLDLGTGENLYPVTTQRVYNANLQVDSGYTLAVGGLEKVADRDNIGGIPVLRDIPGLGYLFKNKNASRDRSNLIIFITPFLISDPAETPGISERPEAVIPIRPGVPPPPPQFTPDGMLVGGEASVSPALAWLTFQRDYFRQTNVEGRTDADSIRRLREAIRTARDLDAFLAAEIQADGGYIYAAALDQAQEAQVLLVDLNRILGKALEDQRSAWLP